MEMASSDHLNFEQNEAVNHLNGPLLIVAGAGAGKTRVIAYRILNLIRRGVSPENILAITFTNKAAKEMRERVKKLIASDRILNKPVSYTETPTLSTFHSLGVRIIRDNSSILNFLNTRPTEVILLSFISFFPSDFTPVAMSVISFLCTLSSTF